MAMLPSPVAVVPCAGHANGEDLNLSHFSVSKSVQNHCSKRQIEADTVSYLFQWVSLHDSNVQLSALLNLCYGTCINAVLERKKKA